MQVLASEIATLAQQIANNENSQFVDMTDASNSEIMNYLNLAYTYVYNKIIDCKEQYFLTSSTMITTGVSDYNLPSDFYKLAGIDNNLTNSSSSSIYPIPFGSRNKYKSGFFIPTNIYGAPVRALLLGSTLRLLPTPSSGISFTLWYYPEPVNITTLSQSLTLISGCVEYMAVYVAILMKIKAEEDTSPLYKRLDMLDDSLRNSIKSRDSGDPAMIRDIASENIYDSYLGGFLY